MFFEEGKLYTGIPKNISCIQDKRNQIFICTDSGEDGDEVLESFTDLKFGPGDHHNGPTTDSTFLINIEEYKGNLKPEEINETNCFLDEEDYQIVYVKNDLGTLKVKLPLISEEEERYNTYKYPECTVATDANFNKEIIITIPDIENTKLNCTPEEVFELLKKTNGVDVFLNNYKASIIEEYKKSLACEPIIRNDFKDIDNKNTFIKSQIVICKNTDSI